MTPSAGNPLPPLKSWWYSSGSHASDRTSAASGAAVESQHERKGSSSHAYQLRYLVRRKLARPAEAALSKTVGKTTSVMVRTTDVVRHRNFKTTKVCSCCDSNIHLLSTWHICRTCGQNACAGCSFRIQMTNGRRKRYVCRRCVWAKAPAESAFAAESTDSTQRVGLESDTEGNGAGGTGFVVPGLVIARAEDRVNSSGRGTDSGIMSDIAVFEAEMPTLIDLTLSRIEDDQHLQAAEVYAPVERSYNYHKGLLAKLPDAEREKALERIMGQTSHVQPLLDRLHMTLNHLENVYEWCLESEGWTLSDVQDISGAPLQCDVWMKKSVGPKSIGVRGRAMFRAGTVELLSMFYDGKLFQVWVPGDADVVAMTSPLQQVFKGIARGELQDLALQGEFSVLAGDALDRNSTLLIYGQTKDASNPVSVIGIQNDELKDQTVLVDVRGGLQVRMLDSATAEVIMVYLFTGMDHDQCAVMGESGMSTIGSFAVSCILPYAFAQLRQELDNANCFANLASEEPRLFSELERRAKEAEMLERTSCKREVENAALDEAVYAEFMGGSGEGMPALVPCLHHGRGKPHADCRPCQLLERRIPCLGLCHAVDNCPHVPCFLRSLVDGSGCDYRPECAFIVALMQRMPAKAKKAGNGNLRDMALLGRLDSMLLVLWTGVGVLCGAFLALWLARK